MVGLRGPGQAEVLAKNRVSSAGTMTGQAGDGATTGHEGRWSSSLEWGELLLLHPSGSICGEERKPRGDLAESDI